MAPVESSSSSSRSLLVLVVDVSPLAWGERDLQRAAQDKARAAAGKRSVGPVVLNELLESVQAFGRAFASEPGAGLLVVGVADNESAVLFPRPPDLNDWLDRPDTYRPSVRDLRRDVTGGSSELLSRACERAQTISSASSRQAAMAAAFSTALCLVNRFLVATRSGGGVTALDGPRFLDRDDDEGVVALMGADGKSGKKKAAARRAAWAPRILLIQASEDRSRDYNAFMNCAFAAAKHKVVVDGCFLTASHKSSSSAFLEQACDLTGGVFLAPSGAAQVDGALTEVLYSVFLAPLSCRHRLNLPALTKVDFRARCFETSESVDLAHVCNLCLSIFRQAPKTACPTCGAAVRTAGKKPRT